MGEVVTDEYIGKFLETQRDGLKLLMKQGPLGSSLFYLKRDNDKVELTKLYCPAMSFDDHPNLKLVDTTGAGDTYTAAFGVRLNEILGVKR